MKQRSSSWLRLALVSSLALATTAAVAEAASTESGEQVGVSSGETVEGNLYIAGDVVTIDGTVTGDLIAAGRRIVVGETGEIGGDLLCAAANVVIEGDLRGDMRCGGFAFDLGETSRVGGEVTTAGFSLIQDEGGAIEGGILSAGAQMILEGEVNDDVRFAGAALALRGSVDGDVIASVAGQEDVGLEEQTFFTRMIPGGPEAPREFAEMGLTIGPEASISGDLDYASPEEVEIPEGGVAGAVRFEQVVVQPEAARPVRRAEANPVLDWFLKLLGSFASLLVFGAIVLYATPRLMRRGSATVAANAMPSAGWGLLTVVVAFAGVFVLLLGTLILLILFVQIGLPTLSAPLLAASMLAFALLTLGTVLLAWVGRAVVGFTIGGWILQRMSREARPLMALTLGTLLLALVISIPIAGAIFGLVASLVGLGAVVGHLFRLLGALRSDVAVTGAAD